MVGYALGVYDFKGKNFLFMLVLFVMMIPLEILMLPLYKLEIKMHIINTYIGVVLPFVVSPSAVFSVTGSVIGSVTVTGSVTGSITGFVTGSVSDIASVSVSGSVIPEVVTSDIFLSNNPNISCAFRPIINEASISIITTTENKIFLGEPDLLNI
jgi:hypothetical protein